MEWLKSAESIMNSPSFGNITGMLGGKPKAAPSVPTPVIAVQAPEIKPSMSSSKMMMIGAGVLAAIALIVVALRK